MKDEDKISFLRGMELNIGWKPGTSFDKAIVKLEMNRGHEVLDYFQMSEIVELVDYFGKLSAMVSLGHTVTPTDRFVFNILKTNGILKAFEEINKLGEYK